MLLQRLLLRPTPLISFSLLNQKSLLIPLQTTSLFTFYSPPTTSSFPSSRSSLRALFSSEALLELPKDARSSSSDDEIESDGGDFGAESEEFVSGGLERVLEINKELKQKLPILSVKEKKELASYAHSLGKKLKSQQVGKSGVTHSVVSALLETLEANELLKLKIHNNCPGELDDVVKQLEEGTGSVVVGRIGRTVIIYKPSLTKLKVEEKKKQAQMVFKKKQPTLKHFQSRDQQPRQSGRGRRGSSRSSA